MITFLISRAPDIANNKPVFSVNPPPTSPPQPRPTKSTASKGTEAAAAAMLAGTQASFQTEELVTTTTTTTTTPQTITEGKLRFISECIIPICLRHSQILIQSFFQLFFFLLEQFIQKVTILEAFYSKTTVGYGVVPDQLFLEFLLRVWTKMQTIKFLQVAA